MSGKKEEAAPAGPPHDLVRRRGQEPTDVSQDNLSASHETVHTARYPQFQEKLEFFTDRNVQDLLNSGLSERRLARYAPAAADGEVSAADFYLWNCDLCEAFYMPLHLAEITCRNTIHSALLFRDQRWYESQTFLKLLDDHRRTELERAIDNERKQHGATADAHHLVSALMLGFWEHLTTKRFERYLFPKGIQKNFRHAPYKKKLQDLHRLIESVRRWRNRIAHHNAVFDKGPSSKYQDALDLISWSSPDLSHWVATSGRVNQVINKRPRRV